MRPFSMASRITIAVATVSLLSACDSAPPSPPVCRISDAHLDDAKGNAGCFIRVNDKLLTIGNRRTGKLDTPGGTAEPDELAQCTAHRETFEETGFNVEVGKLLGEAENGFRFYHCKLAKDVGEDIDSFPVPDWSDVEVDFIKLTDPFETLASEWRYPKRHIENLDLFARTLEKETD